MLSDTAQARFLMPIRSSANGGRPVARAGVIAGTSMPCATRPFQTRTPGFLRQAESLPDASFGPRGSRGSSADHRGMRTRFMARVAAVAVVGRGHPRHALLLPWSGLPVGGRGRVAERRNYRAVPASPSLTALDRPRLGVGDGRRRARALGAAVVSVQRHGAAQAGKWHHHVAARVVAVLEGGAGRALGRRLIVGDAPELAGRDAGTERYRAMGPGGLGGGHDEQDQRNPAHVFLSGPFR